MTERVLICSDRGAEPEEVDAEVINGCTVRYQGATYHHTHNHEDGRWVYTKL